MARNKKSITEEIISLATDSEEQVEASETLETKESSGTEPVNIELQTLTEEPVAAPEAVSKEKIETDVRSKLSRKTVEEDVFVPSNPAALEKEAKAVAEEKGFDLNRGTSIGARLMARRRLS